MSSEINISRLCSQVFIHRTKWWPRVPLFRRQRQIASDPHGFILRQGWASLDFREEEHAALLRKLLESLEREILSILEATNQLRASQEFELYELTAKNVEMFDEVVRKQTALLEKEVIDLTNEADQLAKEIGKLTTQHEPGEEVVT